MYIVIDTETTGLPEKNSNPKNYNLYNNSRLIEIGWYILNENYNLIEKNSFIIKLDYITENKECYKIHKIKTEDLKNGHDIIKILKKFNENLQKCKLLIGHNINFDKNIILSEMYRFNINVNFLLNIKLYDTMYVDKLPKFLSKNLPYNKKYIKLSELYYLIFESEMINSHRVSGDIEATIKCFIMLHNYNKLLKL